MTPERWEAFDRVWHAVLSRPEQERAAAVAELCAGDQGLRHDVESLLGHLARASAAGFGAADSAPGSLIGQQIGPYTIRTLLGAPNRRGDDSSTRARTSGRSAVSSTKC